jgi:hypothetical protein
MQTAEVQAIPPTLAAYVEACCQDLEWLVINAIGKDGRDELERAMDLEPEAWVHGVGYVTGAWFAFGETVVHADNNDQRGGLTYVAPLGEKTGQMIVRFLQSVQLRTATIIVVLSCIVVVLACIGASCCGVAGDFKERTPATPQGERPKCDQAALLWPRLPVAVGHGAVWSRSGVLGHLLLSATRLSSAPWRPGRSTAGNDALL